MKVEEVIKIMDQIINDRTIPKNIRNVVEKSKNFLITQNSSMEIKISAAIQSLDEIINDRNMPLYARTKIWQVVSKLEEMRRK